MVESKIYQGRCRCGAVRYAVTTDLAGMMDCNCSSCRRLGWVMQNVPAAEFSLLAGEDKLESYRFNTHMIDHLFCTACGTESFARGADPHGNQLVMVNVLCLEGAPDIDRSKILHWDGRNA